MDVITATALQNMLKDYYQETKHDAPMEVYVKMYDEIEKNTKDVDGLAVKAIAKVQRNLGIVTTAFTNSDEPTAGARGYQRASIQPRFIKAKGSFDQQLVLMSKTNTGSFVQELSAIVEDLEESIKLSLARQVFGDGSGKICEFTSNGVTTASPATLYVNNTQYLEVGMPLVIYNESGTLVEAITVISVDPTTNSITANTANTINSLYYATTGEAALSAAATECTGLKAATENSGTYFGINRTTYPAWRGVKYNGATAGRPDKYDEVDANMVVNGIMKRSRSKGEDGMVKAFDWLLTDFEAYTQAYSDLVGTRRMVDNVQYKTGQTGILLDDKKIEKDAYCPKTHACVGRITVVSGAPTYVMLSTAGIKAGDLLEAYSGNTLKGHLLVSAVTNGTDFVAAFTAHAGGAMAIGDLIYLDNTDSSTSPVANTAPRNAHSMFFINKDTWQWYVWQDITNYTEQLIGLEFVKVANKTQYEFTYTGLMDLFTETPTKNGRYDFTVEPKFDRNLTM